MPMGGELTWVSLRISDLIWLDFISLFHIGTSSFIGPLSNIGILSFIETLSYIGPYRNISLLSYIDPLSIIGPLSNTSRYLKSVPYLMLLLFSNIDPLFNISPLSKYQYIILYWSLI